MSLEELFGELLGLGQSWRVVECVLSRIEGWVELRVENTEAVWKIDRCPRCGGLPKAYGHTEDVNWDHLPVMQFHCQITACLPRGWCERCNHTRRVRAPWEGKDGELTRISRPSLGFGRKRCPLRKQPKIWA